MTRLTRRHTFQDGWVVGCLPVAVHLVCWQVALGVFLLGGLLRLAAEWARRRTLVAIVTKAPAKTTVIQDSGWVGPAMRIEVGDGLERSQQLGSGRG